MTLFNAQFLTM